MKLFWMMYFVSNLYAASVFADYNRQQEIFDLLTYNHTLGIRYETITKWDSLIYLSAQLNLQDEFGKLPQNFKEVKREADQKLNQNIRSLNALLPSQNRIIPQKKGTLSNIRIVIEKGPILKAVRMTYNLAIDDNHTEKQVENLLWLKNAYVKIASVKECLLIPQVIKSKLRSVLIFARYDEIKSQHYNCIERSLISALGIWGNELNIKELIPGTIEWQLIKDLYFNGNYVGSGKIEFIK